MVSKMAWGIGWTFIKALKSHYWPICFSYKISEELCIMTLKEDAKFKGKLTPGLKKDKRNLVNFRARSGKSENSHYDGILLPKAYIVIDEKLQKSYLSLHWRAMQSLKKKLTFGFKNNMRNLVNFNASSNKSENLHFDVLLFQ